MDSVINTLWGFLYDPSVIKTVILYKLFTQNETDFSKPKVGGLKFFENPFLIYNGFVDIFSTLWKSID